MANILLIDDEPGWLILCRRHLKKKGHEVTVSTDWLRAMRRVWKYRPDIVVLDIEMPKDGLKVLRELKSHWPEVFVIMHSVYSKYKNDPRFALADDFAVKSIDCDNLKKSVKFYSDVASRNKDVLVKSYL